MKRILFLNFFVVGILIASEPGTAGPASGAAAPECPICMQPVDLTLSADNSDEAVTTTPLFGCTHPEHFHASCLAHLLETKRAQTTCPICRQPLIAHPGSNLPAIIQAALPGHQAAQTPVPAHVTHIDQIRHRYNAEDNRLNLSNLNITTIDGVVFEQINEQWPHLQWLYLTNNQLAALPPEIRHLQQLQDLDLSHNELTALPPEIRHLTNLQMLYLSYNPLLAALPPEIVQLCNLLHLNLSNTLVVQSANWPDMRTQLQHDMPHLFITEINR